MTTLVDTLESLQRKESNENWDDSILTEQVCEDLVLELYVLTTSGELSWLSFPGSGETAKSRMRSCFKTNYNGVGLNLLEGVPNTHDVDPIITLYVEDHDGRPAFVFPNINLLQDLFASVKAQVVGKIVVESVLSPSRVRPNEAERYYSLPSPASLREQERHLRMLEYRLLQQDNWRAEFTRRGWNLLRTVMFLIIALYAVKHPQYAYASWVAAIAAIIAISTLIADLGIDAVRWYKRLQRHRRSAKKVHL